MNRGAAYTCRQLRSFRNFHFIGANVCTSLQGEFDLFVGDGGQGFDGAIEFAFVAVGVEVAHGVGGMAGDFFGYGLARSGCFEE